MMANLNAKYLLAQGAHKEVPVSPFLLCSTLFAPHILGFKERGWHTIPVRKTVERGKRAKERRAMAEDQVSKRFLPGQLANWKELSISVHAESLEPAELSRTISHLEAHS